MGCSDSSGSVSSCPSPPSIQKHAKSHPFLIMRGVDLAKQGRAEEQGENEDRPISKQAQPGKEWNFSVRRTI